MLCQMKMYIQEHSWPGSTGAGLHMKKWQLYLSWENFAPLSHMSHCAGSMGPSFTKVPLNPQPGLAKETLWLLWNCNSFSISVPALQNQKLMWYLHSKERTQGPSQSSGQYSLHELYYMFSDSWANANGLAIGLPL